MSESLPDPQLEVRDLRLVLALVRAGTTASAARWLHLAQPSVSRALLSLEDRLDVTLFERTSRGLVPTPAGTRIADHAIELLEALESLERRVRQPLARARRVRMVCECYTAYHWLPDTLLALQELCPNVTVQILVEHTDDPWAALVANQVDVAMVTSEGPPTHEVRVQPLMSDEFVFLMAPDHPLAGRASLTADDVESAQLIVQRSPLHARRWFMRAVFGRRRPRLQATRVPLTEAVVDLARAGLGVAVLTEWVAGPYVARGDLVVKHLDTGPLARPWKLAWRHEASDVAAHMVGVLRSRATGPRSAQQPG